MADKLGVFLDIEQFRILLIMRTVEQLNPCEFGAAEIFHIEAENDKWSMIVPNHSMFYIGISYPRMHRIL